MRTIMYEVVKNRYMYVDKYMNNLEKSDKILKNISLKIVNCKSKIEYIKK